MKTRMFVNALSEAPATVTIHAAAGNNVTRWRFSWNKRNKKHAALDNTVLGWIAIDGRRQTVDAPTPPFIGSRTNLPKNYGDRSARTGHIRPLAGARYEPL